jgi:hypothetical protein
MKLYWRVFTRYLVSLISILWLPGDSANAQNDLRETLDSTRVLAVDFLIANGEIAANQRQAHLKVLPMYEMLRGESVEASSVGIFSFKSLNSPSTSFLMLKDKKIMSILNPKELDNSLRNIISFLKDRRSSDSTILNYIEATLNIYKGNRYKIRSKM